MDRLLYWVVRAVIGFLQSLPLRAVARIGRAGGAMAWWLDARHRRVALENLTLCFGAEKPAAEIRALAKENFRRLGENYCCAAKTASMSDIDVRQVLEVTGVEKFLQTRPGQPLPGGVFAIGHFGNFELYARCGIALPGYQGATTYRALRHPAVTRLMQSLREKSGCLFFERRKDADALKQAMNRGGVVLGLLADQHAGDKGLRLPFLGHDCSTSAAPALFALRYDCRLHTAICRRVSLARWRVEVGDEIPTREHGRPRSPDAIMRDINRAFEIAVRRDPVNWFWVHRRWKPARARPQNPKTRIQTSQVENSSSDPAEVGNPNPS